ncbi:MAG: hypothetical protein JKX92_03530 [Porticoccaceae bacterium]|nr:hypothetical protein [Porticoccaceae bacterium]
MSTVFIQRLYFLLLILCVTNGLAIDIFSNTGNSLIGNVSPVVIIVIASVLRLEGRAPLWHRSHYRLQNAVLICGALIPSSTLAWLTLAYCSGLSARKYRHSRASQLLLLALALAFLWKACLFKLLSSFILPLEMAFMGGLFSLAQPGLTVQDNLLYINEGHILALGMECSVLYNSSLVALGWFSLHLLAHRHMPSLKGCAALLLSIFCLNILRIYLMSISPQWYHIVHEGSGAAVYDFTLSLLISSAIWLRWRSYQQACWV